MTVDNAQLENYNHGDKLVDVVKKESPKDFENKKGWNWRIKVEDKSVAAVVLGGDALTAIVFKQKTGGFWAGSDKSEL